MPKVNDVITNPGEIMKKWAEDHVEIYKNEHKTAEKGFSYENGIYKLIYGRAKSNFAEEKEIMINEYFADLFDTKEIKWKIKNGQNQENKPVRDLFLKYLQKCKFELKSWMAKYRSGRYGIYSLVINKLQTENVDKNGIAITEPIFLPAFVNYKNTRNGEIFEVSVNYQDNIIHGLSLYTLIEVYSINDNKISVTRSVWDIQKFCEIKKPKKELSPATYANYRFDRVESLSQSFLPVAIMPVDLHEKPRCHKIKSKLEMMEKYEEISAILPHWEKGGIMTTSDQVDNTNEEKNNSDFINYLLLKGMVRMKPIVGDSQVFLPFNQSVVTWQPNSLMQTMRNTRNDIWNEIKTDLGIPNIDEIKSAQQTTSEIQANQFLVSPAIEREKMLYVNFLQDFGKKFLMILKECNLKEGSLLQGYDFSDWTVDLDIDLTTQKNILQTMNMITNTPTINNNQEDTNNGK